MRGCPMLTAQYVLLHHIMGVGRSIPAGVAVCCATSSRSRLEGGSWGLHEHSAPNLFVTTLVYVAARLLGVEPDDPLIEPARRFLQAEGVLGIPSWGKFWLALVGLYDWRGVNPVLPELWSLPRWTALHPSKWYCHTRLIYMAMAVIYPLRYRAPVTPAIVSLREELFPEGFDNVDFSSGRNRLRDADLFARPSVWLRVGYRLARSYERFGGRRRRARCTEEIDPAHQVGVANHHPQEHLPGQRAPQHSRPMAVGIPTTPTAGRLSRSWTAGSGRTPRVEHASPEREAPCGIPGSPCRRWRPCRSSTASRAHCDAAPISCAGNRSMTASKGSATPTGPIPEAAGVSPGSGTDGR